MPAKADGSVPAVAATGPVAPGNAGLALPEPGGLVPNDGREAEPSLRSN